MPLPPMTVAIASYQRRGPLLRLLRTLAAQVEAESELGDGLTVVVVLDGSTDGSAEAVRSHPWPMDVEVIEQPNRGLAAARNVGLAHAGDGLVWFLDDDLVPDQGLLALHRGAHGGPPEILVGPCRIPPGAETSPTLRAWWDALYDELAESGRVERFDTLTMANASTPAHLLQAVGGYDERFRGYGLEDYELGVRLLREGTEIAFDPEAVAWHPDVPDEDLLVRREASLGRNAALLAALHPDLVDELFPRLPDLKPRRVLRSLRLRRPRSLLAASRLAATMQRATRRAIPELARRAELLARTAAFASGVSAEDGSGRLLDRYLGCDESARSSRHPRTTPTSNDSTISR
jgi:GT2 family glycosyltransferase